MTSQIAKLLAMLGSDNDGEVLNAVRTLRRQLAADGRSFVDLARVFNANGYARSPEEVWREVQEKHNREYWENVKRQNEERERAQQEYRARREREQAEQRAQREREKSFPKERRQRLKDLRLLRYMLRCGVFTFDSRASGAHESRFMQLKGQRADTIGWIAGGLSFIHIAAISRPRRTSKKSAAAETAKQARLEAMLARVKEQLLAEES
jgi:hypothetical protein